jgi:hypothetical protein
MAAKVCFIGDRLALMTLSFESQFKPLPDVRAHVILDLFESRGNGVRALGRQFGEDLLVILVNEDEYRHLAVDVQGLEKWNGRPLFELYGRDETKVDQGSIAVRMKPFDVKIYCTSRRDDKGENTFRQKYQSSFHLTINSGIRILTAIWQELWNCAKNLYCFGRR